MNDGFSSEVNRFWGTGPRGRISRSPQGDFKQEWAPCWPLQDVVSLYNAFVVGVNHPFIGFSVPSTCKVYTIATLFHDYCAIYNPLPRPPVRLPYTIPYWQWQYCVKAKLPGRVNPSPTDYDG